MYRLHAALLAIACVGFSSSAIAQSYGFFVTPGSSPGHYNSVDAYKFNCKGDPKKEKTVTCTVEPTTKGVEKVPYTTDKPPAALLFYSLNPFCYWDTARQSWNCVP